MNAGEIVASLRLKLDGFRDGIREAQNQVGKFGKDFEKTAADFKKIGGTMVAAGTAIGVGMGSAVKTAADFEAAMSRVGAISGASEKEMKDLTKEAERLGSTTSFSASQAAEGMQFLAMAGWKTTDIIAGMGGVLDMAAAGGVELGDAANIASNIMSGFGIEASKASNVADVLSKTFTSSNTTLNGLGETMKYVAPAASAAGWTLEEMAAATGKLGDVGIDASMAGTALRSAITRLSAPTNKAAELLEEFGINTTDANGKLLPLSEILSQMKTKFADLSETEKAAAVQAIFGTESMSAMLALMEDPKGLEVFTNELENAGGTAEEIATKQMDNLNGTITELKSAFEGAQISLGNALLPALRFLAEGLKSVLNWFNGLPDGVKSSIAIFLALSSVLLVVGGGFLLLVGFIPNIISGLKSLKVVMGALKMGIASVGKAFIWLFTNPVGLVILGIAALIAAIVLIWKNWDTVKAKTIEIWEAIKSYLSVAWEWVKTQFQAFMTWISNLWSTMWNGIKSFFIAIWNGIKAAGQAIWNGMKAAFMFVFNAIKIYFQTVLTIYKTIFLTIWNAIKAVAVAIWNGLKTAAISVFNAIKSTLTSILNGIKSVFTSVWNAIKNFVVNTFNAIKSRAISIWNAIKSTLTSIINGIRSTVTSIFNSIKSTVVNVWNSIRSSISSAISNIRSKVSEGANFMRNTFSGAIQAVKGFFSGLWSSIRGSLNNVVEGIKSKVKKAKEWLTELNPFKRHSPSLVDNVLAGTKIIKDTYEGLGGMRIAPPQIGNLSSGRIDVDQAFGGVEGGGGSGTNYNAPLVQVENMHVRDDRDVRNVSKELFNLQRNHDRAKGGR